jgi:hypothetical protein
MARMAGAEVPVAEALERRAPRTDWLLRRSRIVIVAFVASPAFFTAIRALRSDQWYRAGGGIELAVVIGVVPVAMLVLWGRFVIHRLGRGSRVRRASATGAPWRHHGYWAAFGEKRFVPLAPSRATAKVRRLLEASGWFAIVAGIALTVAHSRAAVPTVLAGVASLAVVFILGVRGAANVDVVWREQPGRTGESVHYAVSVAPMPGGRFDRIEMTLRCVVETSRRRGLSRPELACPFSVTRVFADEIPEGDPTLHARFAVPAGLPPADPEGEPAVFWELVVAAERPGSRLEETFLVPVYASLS